MQAFFTILLAAAFLGDIPTRRHVMSLAVAFAGLVLIGATVGSDLTLRGLGLGVAGALSWAIGNVLVKRTADVPVFPLVVWSSLIPPLPAMVVSAAYEGPAALWEAVAKASWLSIGAAVYLGTMATVVAYAIWGRLLQRYPTGIVAPFALLVPCVGIVSSTAIFGEVFSSTRYAGMVLILAGLAAIVWPARQAGETRTVA